MVFFRRQNLAAKDSAATTEGMSHNLEPGDHVLRWTRLVLYPIQIHGIVLSAGAGMVTIIDFGLSSGGDGRKGNHIEEFNQKVRDKRLNIITLTEQKEVEQWKKVNYGESILSAGKWAKITSWFRREEQQQQRQQQQTPQLIEEDETTTVNDQMDLEQGEHVSEHMSNSGDEPIPPPREIFAQQKKEAEQVLSWLQEDDEADGGDTRHPAGHVDSQGPASSLGAIKNDDDEHMPKFRRSSDALDYEVSKCNKDTSKNIPPPKLPKSDPPSIVLSRVRFLLSDEGEMALPPHHLLYANSECIAVWCKTGRFSTLQSQIFLHSTAFGNAKTATTVALIVGAQTVTVTSSVPAAGLWGWLGFTTTTTSQVGLLSAQPWLIPALAGYGIAAVGTPYLILLQAQGKWEKATSALNEMFWQCATPDVYVDAIRHWSGLHQSPGIG